MTTRDHRRNERARGQSLVEFSLVLIPFLLIVLGLFDLGRYVYSQNTLAEAAREATRWALADGHWEDPAAVEDLAEAMATAVADPVAVVECIDGSGDSTTAYAPPNSYCTRPGYVLRVRVTASLSPISLAAVIGPITLSATSQVALGN
jgi:Flp pilus assembly protein TadG